MPRTLVVIALVIATASFAGDNAAGASEQQIDVEVEWSGTWYPATVIARDGDQTLIRYVGYGADWDEWVGPNRRRWPQQQAQVIARGQWQVGDAVEVEWGGSWWPAEVVTVGGGTTRISYTGYDSSWDEWVGDARIR